MLNRNVLRPIQRLTNYAAGYMAPDLSWIDRAVPIMPVQSDRFEYYSYDSSHLVVPTDTNIGPNTMPWPEVDVVATLVEGSTKLQGLMGFIPDGQTAEERRRDEQLKTFKASYQLLLQKTQEILGRISDASLYAAANKNTSVTNFSTATTDVQAAFRVEKGAVSTLVGGEPNVAIIGRDVANAILRNAIFRDDFKYTTAPTGPTAANDARRLADYLGFDEVYIPNNRYLTGPNATTTTAMWPTETVVMYVRGQADDAGDGTGRLMDVGYGPTAFLQFYNTAIPGAQAGIGAYTVRNDLRGLGGVEVHVFHDRAFAVTMPAGARILTGVLS